MQQKKETFLNCIRSFWSVHSAGSKLQADIISGGSFGAQDSCGVLSLQFNIHHMTGTGGTIQAGPES